MNKIHELSSITTLPELEIFSLPPTQLSIEKNIVTEHRPISTLDKDTVIEFNIDSSYDEYIQLKDMQLYMKIKVDIKNKDGTAVAEATWKKIQPAQNLLQSLFRAVDLEIDGNSVTINPQTYAYKSYFESYLGFTIDSKISHLSAGGWIQNDVETQKDIQEKNSLLIRPTTIDAGGGGKSIDLMGKLFLDLAFQPKAIIGGVKMTIKLIPNKQEFYLWNKDNTINPSVTFEKAVLYVTKAKISQPVVEAHNLALMKGTAKYPITRGYVKGFTANTGLLDLNLDNVFTGQLPKRMFVALVSNAAFNGEVKSNPFDFHHYNINYITASIDGVQYPSVAYTPDFANGLYMREFVGLYDCLNSLSTDSVVTIDRSEYISGNTIFAFDFGNNNCEDCHKSGHLDLIRKGSVRIQMKFSTALTENITVLAYGEFDNLIEIDATRKPITDFT